MIELPMFPLGGVLLPGEVLPLHVFEPRYRELTAVCLAGSREFGVTMIERGFEVGGGDVRAAVGTIAKIVAADEQPDGRWVLVTVGTTRIRVVEWLADDPYPRAMVEPWDEPSDASPLDDEMYRSLCALAGRARGLAAELGIDVGGSLPPFSEDPTLGTYQVGAVSPVGSFDRYRVLNGPGAADRAAVLREILDDQIDLFRLQLGTGNDSDDERDL